jgi:hypothetical protein
LRAVAIYRSHLAMMSKSAILAGIGAIIVASLMTGGSQARTKAGLFGTVDEALAFTRGFGSHWQTSQKIPSRIKSNDFPERVFQFGPNQFVSLTTDRSGVVHSFMVVDYTPLDLNDRTHTRKCSRLLGNAELSKLMLRAAEANYTKKDLVLVQGVAKRGWMPVFGELGAKVNNTSFWFSSWGKRCGAEMRDGGYLAGRPWG